MIEHCVLIKLKPGDEDRASEICKALNGLKDKIPEIVEFSAGENISERSGGYQLGLRSLFHNQSDLDAYIKHPEHISVVETMILPFKEDVVVLDYTR